MQGVYLFFTKKAESKYEEKVELIPDVDLEGGLEVTSEADSAWEILKKLSTIVFAKENQPRLMLVSLLTVIGVMMNYIAPYLLGVTIESLKKSEEELDESMSTETLTLFLIGAYTLSQLIPKFREMMMAPVTANNNAKMITDIVEHQLNRPMQYHFKTPGSDQTYLVNKGFDVMSNVSTVFTSIIPTMLEITLATAVLSNRYGYGMGLGFVGTAAAFTAYSAATTERVIEAKEKMRETGNTNWGKIQNALKQFKQIHDFDKYSYIMSKIKASINKTAVIEINKIQTPLKVSVGHILLPRLGMLVALLYVVNSIKKRDLNEQDFIYLLSYLNQLSIMLPSVGESLNSLFGGYPDLKYVFNELAQPIDKPIKGLSPIEIEGPPSIRFENVSFSYPDLKTGATVEVFSDLSFEVKAGETVALVSQSGGGKSTIFKLLFQYYQPSSGKIYINDQDISLVDRDSLRKQIGVIGQGPCLSHGNVKENILFGAAAASNVTTSDIIAIARRANLLEFIESLKLDTQVGDSGNQLSGGQQQRVAILRGLMKKSSIRLMDEITSALDGPVAKQVLQGVLNVTKNETRMMITHKLSEAQYADKVIVLARGRVVAEGRHDDLVESCSVYQKAWQAQNAPQRELPIVRL